MPSYTYYCVLLCFDILTPIACPGRQVPVPPSTPSLLRFFSPFAFYYSDVPVLRYANFWLASFCLFGIWPHA